MSYFTTNEDEFKYLDTRLAEHYRVCRETMRRHAPAIERRRALALSTLGLAIILCVAGTVSMSNAIWAAFSVAVLTDALLLRAWRAAIKRAEHEGRLLGRNLGMWTGPWNA